MLNNTIRNHNAPTSIRRPRSLNATTEEFGVEALVSMIAIGGTA